MNVSTDAEILTILEADPSKGRVRVRLKGLATPVSITVSPAVGPGEVRLRMSHAVHTPLQAGPYRTSRDVFDDQATALQHGRWALTHFYSIAVAAGHPPSDEWLVPNS